MPRERLTVVIPVLNEEAVLDRLADHLRAVLEGLELSWDVLFVDDGSRQMAATANKENYRGIASTIADIVNSDPRHSYILYEVSGSRDLNYYLSKLDTEVRSLRLRAGRLTVGEFA